MHCVVDRVAVQLSQLAPAEPAILPANLQLLEASRAELAQVEQLLGGDASALRLENQHLHRCLAQARSLLAENSPAPLGGGDAAGPSSIEHSGRSPLPFALFERPSSDAELAAGDYSPATTISLVGPDGCPSPDVFSSPFLASQTTLTVDYRSLQQQATPSSTRQQVGGLGASKGAAWSSPAMLQCLVFRCLQVGVELRANGICQALLALLRALAGLDTCQFCILACQ